MSGTTHEWVIQHIWMSHTNNTYEWVKQHIWMSCTNNTYEWDIQHIWMSHETYQTWMSHTTHMNESRVTLSVIASWHKWHMNSGEVQVSWKQHLRIQHPKQTKPHRKPTAATTIAPGSASMCLSSYSLTSHHLLSTSLDPYTSCINLYTYVYIL